MSNPSPANPFPVSGLRTPIAVRFQTFLYSADRMVDAERDLADYSGQDPAVDAWIRDAEAAHRSVLGEAATVMSLPAQTEADLRMQAIARLFLLAMKSSEPEQMTYLRQRAHQTEVFLMPWGDPVNFRLNQMILQGLGLFESYAALDDGMFDANADEPQWPGPGDAAPTE